MLKTRRAIGALAFGQVRLGIVSQADLSHSASLAALVTFG